LMSMHSARIIVLALGIYMGNTRRAGSVNSK
jgi:hypothetical protein